MLVVRPAGLFGRIGDRTLFYAKAIAGVPFAMVRYRSRRDFLDFALEIERGDIVMHKWAAIASTHVFPVQPLLSLVMVRGLVLVLLALLGLAAFLAAYCAAAAAAFCALVAHSRVPAPLLFAPLWMLQRCASARARWIAL